MAFCGVRTTAAKRGRSSAPTRSSTNVRSTFRTWKSIRRIRITCIPHRRNSPKAPTAVKRSRRSQKAFMATFTAIWIAPNDPKRIIAGEDGGYALTVDGGQSWAFWPNLPIGQFYRVGLGNDNPYTICGGLQDNNSYCGPSNSLDMRRESKADGLLRCRMTTGNGQFPIRAMRTSFGPTVRTARSSSINERRANTRLRSRTSPACSKTTTSQRARTDSTGSRRSVLLHGIRASHGSAETSFFNRPTAAIAGGRSVRISRATTKRIKRLRAVRSHTT